MVVQRDVRVTGRARSGGERKVRPWREPGAVRWGTGSPPLVRARYGRVKCRRHTLGASQARPHSVGRVRGWRLSRADTCTV